MYPSYYALRRIYSFLFSDQPKVNEAIKEFQFMGGRGKSQATTRDALLNTFGFYVGYPILEILRSEAEAEDSVPGRVLDVCEAAMN